MTGGRRMPGVSADENQQGLADCVVAIAKVHAAGQAICGCDGPGVACLFFHGFAFEGGVPNGVVSITFLQLGITGICFKYSEI